MWTVSPAPCLDRTDGFGKAQSPYLIPMKSDNSWPDSETDSIELAHVGSSGLSGEHIL